jgi:hypothetical protein
LRVKESKAWRLTNKKLKKLIKATNEVVTNYKQIKYSEGMGGEATNGGWQSKSAGRRAQEEQHIDFWTEIKEGYCKLDKNIICLTITVESVSTETNDRRGTSGTT